MVAEATKVDINQAGTTNNMDESDEIQQFLEENRVILENRNQLRLLREAALQQQQEQEDIGDDSQQKDFLINSATTTSQQELELNTVDIKQQLVDIIPSYPVLWNTSLRSYKDLNKKEAAWNKISMMLNNVSSKYLSIKIFSFLAIIVKSCDYFYSS